MRQYIGTKCLLAKPMTRAQYNAHRGWTMPAGENGDDAGYLVEYSDGYISWSPAPQFEEAYRATEALTFGLALDALKKGYRVSRAGWNGKGMWLTRINGNANFAETTYEQLPYIAMKTVDNKIVPWLASQTDLLAEDWSIT